MKEFFMMTFIRHLMLGTGQNVDEK